MVPKLNAHNPVTVAVNIQLPTRCTPALLRPPFLSSAIRHTHMWENADTSTFLAQSVLIELSHGLIQFPWTKACSMNDLPPQFPNPSRYGSFRLSIPAFDTSQLYLLLRRKSSPWTWYCHDPTYFRLLLQPSPLLRTRLGVCSPSVFSCQAPPKPALLSALFPPLVRLLS